MYSHLVVSHPAGVLLVSVISFHPTFAFQLHHADHLKTVQKLLKPKLNQPIIRNK